MINGMHSMILNGIFIMLHVLGLLYCTTADAQVEIEGMWDQPFSLPTHPEQMAVLPSGKVLMWPWAPERRTPRHGPLALWNPQDGSSEAFRGSGIESASGLAFQPDGVLLIAGGDMPRGGVDGNPKSFIFDFTSETLSRIENMSSGRVFPSATTLGNGQIIVMAGLNENKRVNAVPELYDGSAWSALPRARSGESTGPTFQFLLSDGRIFRAGPERLSDWLDPDTFQWSKIPRKYRNQVRYRGAAVMYAPDKILLTGGCPAYNCNDTPPLSSAEVIDLNASDPAWRKIQDMTFSRHSHHATLLPDGTVLITGGTGNEGLANDVAAGVLEVELWNPASMTFSAMAPMDEPRHFQSAAVLLPDGRVFLAGGKFGTNPSDADDAEFSWTGQIFSPPYLFKGERPLITSCPDEIRYGYKLQLEMEKTFVIEAVSLMGLSASSQNWNGTQRICPLEFEQEGQGLAITTPDSPNLAPPGFYLLFILDSKGVPSEGQMVQLTGKDDG
jgi:galactose oxidase